MESPVGIFMLRSIHNRNICSWTCQRQWTLWRYSFPPHYATLRAGQDGCHFADDILKLIYLYQNCGILIQISLKIVPKCLIDNISASPKDLVTIKRQAMSWTNDGPVHWSIYIHEFKDSEIISNSTVCYADCSSVQRRTHKISTSLAGPLWGEFTGHPVVKSQYWGMSFHDVSCQLSSLSFVSEARWHHSFTMSETLKARLMKCNM